MTQSSRSTQPPLSEEVIRVSAAATIGVPPATIGLDVDLFELGLDSLGLIRLAADWRRHGLNVDFEHLAETATVRDWFRILAAAADEMPSAEDPDTSDLPDESASQAGHSTEDDAFPLGPMQHAYWIGRQDDQPLGGVGAHFYVEMDGFGVDPQRLGSAAAALRRRHEMLRITVLDDGSQRVLPADDRAPIEIHDLTTASPAEVTTTLARLRDHFTHRRMDVENGEVLDIALSVLPDGATRLHIDLDMVAADAASMRILLSDLQRLYAEPDTPLPPITDSYRDYLRRSQIARAEDRAASGEWWRERLDTLGAAPALPTVVDPLSRESSDPRYHRTTRLHHRLTPERTELLLKRARRHGLTPTAVLATAFAETLGAWSAEPRFTLNLPLFHRDLSTPEVELLVGDFSSSILLDVDLNGERFFVDVAHDITARLRAAIAHGSYPGVEVLRDLSRAAGGNAVLAPVVYTSALGLGEVYDQAVRDTFGEPVWIISQGPQVWLDAQVTELDGGILLNWDIRESLFEPGVPAAAFAAYRDLVERLLDDEQAWWRCADVRIPAAQRDVRERANATDAPPVTERLHEGFQRVAALHPEHVALVEAAGESVTYGELAWRAGQVTALLASHGVRSGDTVAVSLPRGVKQIAAVLGVLGSGATYVPIGIEQPADRARRVAEAADAVAVLTDIAHARPQLGPVTAGTPAVLRYEEAALLEPVPPIVDQPVDSIAYVIFTSGSTGVPKGVEVSHGAALNTIAALNARFEVGESDRGLALAELDFDMSVYDLFAPLSAGGSVVLIDEDARRDATFWVGLVRDLGVTLINCVPALLDMLLTAAESDPDGLGDSLRLVLLGGDWVGLTQPDRLRALNPTTRFVALGGMTEAAVHSTIMEVAQVDPAWASIPWGVPLPNVRARVADHRGRDCPDWVPGELWISGAGLAAGYRGDPERTEEKFVEHDGRRWYRTGDRARYRADGVLEFLGRTDHQVKLRGHRIELGEIEAAATERADIASCVALITGQPRRLALVAAGHGSSAPSEVDLRDTLDRSLPAYMVPTQLLIVDALPLTRNGKPDRARVAELVDTSTAATSVDARREPPTGWAETVLAQVWSEVLGLTDAIGRDDEFFALGGDSLLATRMIVALRARGVGGARVARLFATPRLADFAATLSRTESREQGMSRGDLARRHEPFPATDVQRAFWIGRDDRLPLGGVGTYHYSEFDDVDVDIDRMERAWRALIARHEMLRAVFDADGRQRILSSVPEFTIPVTEVTAPEDAEAVLTRLRQESSHRRLDVTRWPLFDLRAVRYPKDGRVRTRLAIGLDYLVLDGASIIALYGELDRLYADLDTVLPPIDVSFRDYVLQVVPEKDAVERAQQYWLRRLDELPPAPALPLAADPSTVDRPWFTRRSRPVPAARWADLRAKARHHGLTPSSVLLACYVEVLAAWSDQPGVTVNLTLFNRLPVHPHIDRLVGDFTSVSLIGHRPRSDETWVQTAHRVQRVMSEDLDHRETSAIWLLQELAKRTGTVDAAMPVVFSSSVGVGDTEVKDLSETFPAKLWGISQTPQVLLDNQVTEADGGVLVSWDAIEELFRDGVLDAMFDSYVGMLDWLVDHDWTGFPPILPRREPDRIRPQAAVAVDHDPTGTLHHDFLRRAEDEPERTALLWPTGSMSYGALSACAARVAAGLIERGVQPGDTVAIALAPGPDQIVAAIGTLYAGAAYLAIDAGSPPAEQSRWCRDADIALVIAEDGAPTPQAGPRQITMSVFGDCPTMSAAVPRDGTDAAYRVVTSVSDGANRVFSVSHLTAGSAVLDVRTRFDLDKHDRVLAVSGLESDLSIFDIFGLLGAGGALVMPGSRGWRDPAAWAGLAARHGVTVWNGPPVLLDLLLAEIESGAAEPTTLHTLRLALVSKERVGRDLPSRTRRQAGPHLRFAALGTVAPGVFASVAEIDRKVQARPSIPYGEPLAGRRLRVVDAEGRDRPDWVVGELWVGGRSHFQGDRCTMSVSPAPFVDVDGQRWYRTGNRARYLPDGSVEFLGESWRKISVGGRHVELDEVEAAVESHPQIVRAVVLTPASCGEGRPHLIALIRGRQPTDLPRHLVDRLPPHAIPTKTTYVDALPITSEGTVDHAALAVIVAAEDGLTGPPAGVIETRIAEIWSEILGAPVSDRYTSFFSAGGDSLSALRLVAAVSAAFGVDVSVRSFLTASTLIDLAMQVESSGGTVIAEESGVI